MEGFNATLLAFGQSGTGKSATLLGGQSDEQEPLVHQMLHSLFSSCSSTVHRIGLSCWELVQHQVVDLLADGSQQPSKGQVSWKQCVRVRHPHHSGEVRVCYITLPPVVYTPCVCV